MTSNQVNGKSVMRTKAGLPPKKVADPPPVPPFNSLVKPNPPERLLALDPGGTTGWALFIDGEPKHCGQLPGNADSLEILIKRHRPTLLVIESYSLYPWKAKSQSFSQFPTVQLIGALRFIASKLSIPVELQPASRKKFTTDTKLKHWRFFQKGKPHANDAIRHACYRLVFGRRC